MNPSVDTALQYSDYSLTDLRQYFGRFDRQGYEIDFTGLASGAQEVSKTLQFDSASLFVWEAAEYQATLAGSVSQMGSMPFPNVRVQMEDTTSGRELFSEPVYISSIFGITGFPFRLPVCRYFEAATRVLFTLYNDGSSANLNIKFTLLGKRFYGEA